MSIIYLESSLFFSVLSIARKLDLTTTTVFQKPKYDPTNGEAEKKVIEKKESEKKEETEKPEEETKMETDAVKDEEKGEGEEEGEKGEGEGKMDVTENAIKNMKVRNRTEKGPMPNICKWQYLPIGCSEISL